MDKKYLSKIIATDNEGLQVISACCSGAEVKVNEIKYLQKNKVFLLSLKRSKVETEEQDKNISPIPAGSVNVLLLKSIIFFKFWKSSN